MPLRGNDGVTTGDLRQSSGFGNWRTPFVVIACGCAIALLSFGPRASFGFFVQPMSRDFAPGRDVFGLALAVQNSVVGARPANCRRDR